MKQKRKKLGRKLLSFLLTLAMVVGLMSGMGLTAYADVSGAGTEAIHTFNAAYASGDNMGEWQYVFPLAEYQKSMITKIEVLIDMLSIAEKGWGQVVYSKGEHGQSDRVDHTAAFENTPCVKKYTAGEGSINGAQSAVVQLVGKGRLLAYTITFTDGGSITGGDWTIPEITPPVAEVGLKVTGLQQKLVTEGALAGTGTFEYSLDNKTWSTDVPKGKDAGSYTVYYRIKYNNKIYRSLQGEQGIPVSIAKKEVTVTAKNLNIYVGGEVPTLSAPILGTHYSVTGLVGTDELTTAPTLVYQKDGSAATPDNTAAGTYDIVASGASAGDNYTIAYSKGTLTISEKQPATVTKAPEAKTLTYTGSAQELVTAGTASGGTMQYAIGENSTTAPSDNLYTASIPSKTDAGTYYVWYMVKGDEHHTDSKAACVTATINKKEISRTVTFKVVNGSWDDGTTNDKSETLKGYEGDELKLSKDQIPAVGNKPGSGYAAGSWDKTPSTSTAITGAATYTYTYTKASDEPSEEPSSEKARVTKAPTAKKLTYNGKSQALVKAGKAQNGTMYYAVTTKNSAPKASAYKTSIPTGKAAGTYYVWYKVKGDEGYKDSAVKKVKVTIAKKTEEEPFNFNTSFKVTQKDGQVTVTWNKVNGLSKVDAYVAYCGTNYPEKKCATTTKNTLTIKKIAGKKIDLTKNFKLILAGYDSTGKKIKKSVSLHIAGKDNEQFTNVKSFTLSKSSVSLKKGKSTKVSVKTYKLEDTKKKEISNAHGAKFRYRSTNSNIAKVDKTGKIIAVKPGKCKVFVYTRNGLSRRIALTVTK